MTPDMMVDHRSRRHARLRRAGPQAVVRDPDAPGRVSRAARRRRRRPRASAAVDRIRGRRHPARPRRARRGRDDARAAFRSRSTARRRRASWPTRWRRTSRRTTACCSPITARSRSAAICSRAYYKMETIEHFARISLVARHARPRAPALARRSRAPAGAARHATASPRRRRSAPIPSPGGGADADPSCQVIVAPSAPGERLVARHAALPAHAGPVSVGTDGEIRLTYAQLTELIDEAVRQLARHDALVDVLSLRSWVLRGSQVRPSPRPKTQD